MKFPKTVLTTDSNTVSILKMWNQTQSSKSLVSLFRRSQQREQDLESEKESRKSRVLFLNFVMQLKWRSSIRCFSQIWKKPRILLYFCLPAGTYHKNLAIWKKKFLQTGPFFPLKILCIGRNHIFQVDIWRNFSSRKKTLSKSCMCRSSLFTQ